MKIFGLELRRAPESRSIENTATPLTGGQLLAALGVSVDAPINVTPANAIQLAAVYSCIRVISQTLASVPLRAFARTSAGHEKANNLPIYQLLSVSPNGHMSAFVWVEMILWNLLQWGSHYSEIETNGAGQVVALWPLLPWKMRVKIAPSGERFYFYSAPNGGEVPLKASQVLHVEGPCGGLSVIAAMRKSIALGMAAEDFGSKFFQNGARLSGVLTTDNKLSPEAAARLREDFTKLHSGLSNSHRIAVLEQGLKFNQTSVNPEDAQFLETRKYQRSEIAGFFQVPPHLIGDLERATFSNIEHQGIAFVQYCLMPWAARIESECNLKLFADPATHFVKFNLNGLMRGDMKTRFEAYNIGRNGGWLSANDIRELEDMNRIDGGDAYLTALNMAASNKPASDEPKAKDANANETGNEDEQKNRA